MIASIRYIKTVLVQAKVVIILCDDQWWKAQCSTSFSFFSTTFSLYRSISGVGSKPMLE